LYNKDKKHIDVIKMQKRGQVWVSAILYTVVIIVAITLILSVGVPLVNKMKDRIVFSRAKDMMLGLDKHIVDIASEGEGSQRVIPLEIPDGELKVENNQIVWRFNTESDIVTSRTKIDVGNLVIISNANVESTTNIADDGNGSFILKTELGGTDEIIGDDFIANISMRGSEDDWVSINTSKLINYIVYDDNIVSGTFSFSINDNSSSSYGNGYTRLVPSGNNTNLGRAKVIAHINSSYASYDLEFVLESYADFLTIDVKNFVKK
jgi:hypothetical protein